MIIMFRELVWRMSALTVVVDEVRGNGGYYNDHCNKLN